MTKYSKRSVVFLSNTSSRLGRKYYDFICDYFSQNEKVELIQCTHIAPSAFEESIQAAIALHPDVLVVGSGDGTISTVLQHIVGTDVALGILPLGTSNNYARTLGIPMRIDEALEIISSGRMQRVDTAQIDDIYFANVASIGLSTNIARAVSPKLKRLFGRIAYAVAGIQSLLTHGSFFCEIITAEGTHTFQTHQLVIANGSHHAGVHISDDATITSGKVFIFSMDNGNRFRLLLNFIRYNIGGVKALRDYTVITTSEAHIRTIPERSIEIDGEISARTPVKIVCKQRDVRVVID